MFFAKTSEIHVLNKAIIYARENELCDRIIICHVYQPISEIPQGFGPKIFAALNYSSQEFNFNQNQPKETKAINGSVARTDNDFEYVTRGVNNDDSSSNSDNNNNNANYDSNSVNNVNNNECNENKDNSYDRNNNHNNNEHEYNIDDEISTENNNNSYHNNDNINNYHNYHNNEIILNKNVHLNNRHLNNHFNEQNKINSNMQNNNFTPEKYKNENFDGKKIKTESSVLISPTEKIKNNNSVSTRKLELKNPYVTDMLRENFIDVIPKRRVSDLFIVFCFLIISSDFLFFCFRNFRNF